jgi:hypothetical protein
MRLFLKGKYHRDIIINIIDIIIYVRRVIFLVKNIIIQLILFLVNNCTVIKYHYTPHSFLAVKPNDVYF